MANVELRTAEELAKPIYNYFIAYSVDPHETDVGTIEKLLQAKNRSPDDGMYGKRLKKLFGDAREIMINDRGYDAKTGTYSIVGARALEAKAACRFKLKEAGNMVRIMSAQKGRIFKTDLQTIVAFDKKFGWFTIEELEKEVEELFTKEGIKYIDDTQSIIDFVKFTSEIDQRLEGTLHKRDLYDLLGKTPQDSLADLQTASAELYSKNRAITSPVGTANAKVGAYAQKNIFDSAEHKKSYDLYIATKADVWDKLALRKAYQMTELPIEEYLVYADIIRKKSSLDLNQVEIVLSAGVKYFKLTVVGSDDADIKDDSGDSIKLEICPYPECGKAYRVFKNKATTSCPHCGKPLEILCWNCGGKMPYTVKNKTCPTCGATSQSKALFDAKLADVEKIVRLPACSIMDLRSALANLKNVIPNYQANKGSLAYKKVDEYEKIIAQKIKEEETTGASYKKDVEKIQAQITQKNYQQALNLASGLRRTYPTYNAANTAALINDINRALSLAQAQVQQAKAYLAQKNENQVIACAAKALEICADYSEARQLLPPPEAPSNVRVNITGNHTVRIEWVKTGNQNLTTYTIIKKVGSRPTGVTDGTVIESNLTINFYEDSNVVSATPYYYAVFADRCEKTSGLAVSNGAVQVFLDVQNVRQEVVTDAIRVKWDVPHNVKAVEVWKKEGPVAPLSAGDGTRVAMKSLDGFTDTADTGECSYLILCQYEVGGAKKYSQGIQRVFKQYKPLQKLDKVSILPQPTGDFLLKCDAPQDGKVSVVYCKDRLSCRVDTVLQMLDFNQLCKNTAVANISYDAEQNMLFTLPPNQVVWAYPMVSNEQLFVLSAPVLLNTISGIRNVSFTEINGTVKITGVLNTGIKNVIVKISTQKFPIDIDDEGDKLAIPKDRFEAEGGAIVKLKADTLSYISVFTEIEQNGKTTYTRAIPISDEPIGTLRKKVVQYAIEYTVSPTKRFTVTLKFAADEEVDVPRLCVMKGYPRPMDKTAGELVEKIQPFTLKKGLFAKQYTAKQTLTVPPDSLKTKFAAFIDDDTKKFVQLKEVRKI